VPIQATNPVTTPGVGSVVTNPVTTPAGATASGGDKEMFLQLLVAQMRYQDPMNPTDSSQFLAQSAQFTALEKMQAVADHTAQLLGAQLAFGASGMIGKSVTFTGADGASATGTVGGVTFSSEGPVLDIDGTAVPIAAVTSVGTVSAIPAATPAATSPTTPDSTPTPAV